ncbi:hypothetical protein DFJ74DRAFT_677700 [Hyaloraphidium curvatum]|nr:hypothetical protein DFJ74DRAFT_677700 [Hyaloraphidium curvatum]
MRCEGGCGGTSNHVEEFKDLSLPFRVGERPRTPPMPIPDPGRVLGQGSSRGRCPGVAARGWGGEGAKCEPPWEVHEIHLEGGDKSDGNATELGTEGGLLAEEGAKAAWKGRSERTEAGELRRRRGQTGAARRWAGATRRGGGRERRGAAVDGSYAGGDGFPNAGSKPALCAVLRRPAPSLRPRSWPAACLNGAGRHSMWVRPSGRRTCLLQERGCRAAARCPRGGGLLCGDVVDGLLIFVAVRPPPVPLDPVTGRRAA